VPSPVDGMSAAINPPLAQSVVLGSERAVIIQPYLSPPSLVCHGSERQSLLLEDHADRLLARMKPVPYTGRRDTVFACWP